MRKIITLLVGILMMASAAAVGERQATIQSMTDLGNIQKKLDEGITIGKVYYTDGYGFSASEFTTDDPEEIALLWEAVNAIAVGERVNESMTDRYPQIVFYLTDGAHGGVRFEANRLCVSGMENYEISNAEGFWNLTATLKEKHEQTEEGAVRGGWDEIVDGGWGAASDPAITDSVKALFDKGMEGLIGVDYVPVAYLGSQMIAGYNHAILCLATAVYPEAQPHWVIVYLSENLEGGVSVTDIAELQW